jgi:hypothetical protein
MFLLRLCTFPLNYLPIAAMMHDCGIRFAFLSNRGSNLLLAGVVPRRAESLYGF